ncbi:hypothetical protein CHUAL_004751 [Chamberlinius hualienensis]
MITERESPQSKLSRLQFDRGSVESIGVGDSGNSEPVESPVDCRMSYISQSAASLMKRESHLSASCASFDEDSDSSSMAIDVHTYNSDRNSSSPSSKNRNVPIGWATNDLMHSPIPNGLDLAGHLKRKEVFNARKQREFIPDNKKDDTYWDRRRRNNEAAKRSREKRRLNDMVLETRVLELTKENTILKTQLMAIRDQFGIIGENLVGPDGMVNAIQQQSDPAISHHHQVALNLSKRAKLLTPILGPGGVVHTPQTAAVSMMAAAAVAASNPAPPVAAHSSANNGKLLLAEHVGRDIENHLGRGIIRNANSDVHNSAYSEYWNLSDSKYHSNKSGNIIIPTSAFSHHLQQPHSPQLRHTTSPHQTHHQFVVPNGANIDNNASSHQEALINERRSPHEDSGYAISRYSDRYSPTYANTVPHQVQMEFVRSNDSSIVAQQINNRHGYAHNGHAYRQHSQILQNNHRLSNELRNINRNGDKNNNNSHLYDDCCSNCSSSVVVDVENYTPSSGAVTPVNTDGNLNGETQLHLPHKLRHKPRLSETSAPALSPPDQRSPPLNPHQRDKRASSASSNSSDSPDSHLASTRGAEGDDSDDTAADIRTNRRKRKASVFVGETSIGNQLETENTELKMEMQRLAIEVAGLKDILFCKAKVESGNAKDAKANGSNKSDASSRDSGFVTETDKDDEMSCS